MSSLAKREINTEKIASVMTMIEHMVETRGWKMARELMEYRRCRLCGEFNETVEHLASGCKTIANSGYLARHNRALMAVAVAWAKEYGLVGKNKVVYRKMGERTSLGGQ